MATVPIPAPGMAVLVQLVREMQDAASAARTAADGAATTRARAAAVEAALRAALHVGTDATLDLDHACFVVPDVPASDGVAP